MAIQIIRFRHQLHILWGKVADGVITVLPGDHDTTAALLRAHTIEAIKAVEGPTLAESEVELLSPVTQNQQFVCQGANYRQHMIESGLDPEDKTYNMIFTKASSCIVPAHADVIKPQRVRFLDYEIELGLVLARDITDPQVVTGANLHKYIAGLVIVNDYSARDVQIPEMQFYKGKSFRTFGPVGPYLCLLEPGDFVQLYDLDLTLTVNGGVRQKDSTRNLVFRPAETLTELSGVHDLFTGDLIATGTPAGCALRVPSPFKRKIAAMLPEAAKWKMFMKVQEARTEYLKLGDLVEAHIKSADGVIDLGHQSNRIVGEAQ